MDRDYDSDETAGEDFFDFSYAEEIKGGDLKFHRLSLSPSSPVTFERGDPLGSRNAYICGRLVEAAHGLMKGDGFSEPEPSTSSEPCSLLIFEWSVHMNRSGMRVQSACIDLTFSSKDSAMCPDKQPCVVDFAPRGAYSLFETEREVEKSHRWKHKFALGGNGVANAKASHAFVLKETSVQKDHVYVDGIPMMVGDVRCCPSRQNAIRWNIFENRKQKSGIPRHFRTAVLLNRNGNSTSRFLANINCRIRISPFEDIKDLARSLVGYRQMATNDPLEFNPADTPRTNDFRDRVNSLGGDSVVLEELIFFEMFRKNSLGKEQYADSIKE